jgi:hypothetical protein
MNAIQDRFEYTADGEVFFDYCLWEYKPVVPYLDKFRSINLLYHSFGVAGMDEKTFKLVRAIREGIGASRTVWGLKKLGDKLAWEFYFYDYRRKERERSITKLLNIIRPFIRCDIKPNENFHYFMFSIDINNDLISGTKELEEIHMYIGNVGSTVSSGICYLLTTNETKLENFYFFFDPKKQENEILSKVVCSAYMDSSIIPVDQILWPELRRCKVIVVANKQNNDSVYFSGINVDQLIFFMERMDYPEELVSFVEGNRSNLDHLQYDVGIDYRMVGNELVFLKSGYYGVF